MPSFTWKHFPHYWFFGRRTGGFHLPTLHCQMEQTVEQTLTIEFLVIWDVLKVMWITMTTAGPFKWLLGACPSISWAVAGLRNTLRFQCNLKQISKYKVFQYTVCKRRHIVWALVWLSRHTKRICKETETDKERERNRENEIKGERSGWLIKPQWKHDISCQTERFNNRTKKHQFPFTGTKWTILIGTSSRPCGWIFTCEWYFPFERSD